MILMAPQDSQLRISPVVSSRRRRPAGVIRRRDLPSYLHGNRQKGQVVPAGGLSDLSRLRRALKETGGDKTAASRVLGWSRMKIYRVLKREHVGPGEIC